MILQGSEFVVGAFIWVNVRGYCHDSVLHDWLSSAVFFSNQVCFECIDIVFGIIIMRKEIQNTTAWNAAPNQWLSLHHALQMHVDTHCWTSVLTSIKPGELLLGTITMKSYKSIQTYSDDRKKTYKDFNMWDRQQVHVWIIPDVHLFLLPCF